MSKAAVWHSAPPAPADALLFAESNQRRLPAWLLSLGLHLLVVLALGLVVRVTPRGAATEPDRTGGIVLVQQAKGEPRYFAEGDVTARESAAEATEAETELMALPSDSAPVDIGSSLPLPGANPLGSEALAGAALPSASEFMQSSQPTRRLQGSQVETGVFGVTGAGTKFVYVFDRSGSMNGFGGRPMAAAKAELIKSLESLEQVHQFQIIFYNHEPTVFNPFRPQPPKLLFGDSANKDLAMAFVRNMTASGGTHHMDALKLALAMSPDVIFFLTDADEPELTHSELAEIRRRNRSEASINTIEFGIGPAGRRFNFMMKLSADNGGRHAYVDVTRLPGR